MVCEGCGSGRLGCAEFDQSRFDDFRLVQVQEWSFDGQRSGRRSDFVLRLSLTGCRATQKSSPNFRDLHRRRFEHWRGQ